MKVKEKLKLDMAKVKCLIIMCGVTTMSRVRNEVVKVSVGVPEKS